MPKSDKNPEKSPGCDARLAACGVAAEALAETAAAEGSMAVSESDADWSEFEAVSVSDSLPVIAAGAVGWTAAGPPACGGTEDRRDEPDCS